MGDFWSEEMEDTVGGKLAGGLWLCLELAQWRQGRNPTLGERHSYACWKEAMGTRGEP